jgi:hypothetical protein
MKKSALTIGLLSLAALAASEETTQQKTQLIYDDNNVISLGEHNHQEFFDMAQDLTNSTAVVFIYARKY